MGVTYNPLLGSGIDFTGGAASVSIGTPIAGSTPHAILVVDSVNSLGEVGPLADGQLLIGSTGNLPVAAALTGTTDQVVVTNGVGAVTLSLPQSINTTNSPTFNTVVANVDKAGTLNVGAANATILNLGSGTSAVNVLNTLNVNTHKVTNVVDPTLAQDAATKNYTDITFIPLTQKAAALGVATLDGGGKIPASQLPNSVMELQGFWNATTNTPTLTDGTGNPGDVYEVSVAGTTDFGNGPISFAIGDWAVYAADGKYHKSLNSNAVTSVNSQTGTVVLDTDDISEGTTNLYYTDVRAQASITGGASSIVTTDLTFNKALTSDGAGKVAVSTTTATELGYVSGVTSAIQTQLNTISGAAVTSLTGDVTGTGPGATATTIANLAVTNAKIATGVDATKISSGVVSNTEFDYLDGVTSPIQTQLNNITGAAITSLTGDVTATGPGASASTIANLAVTNAKIAAGVDAAKISSGVVSNTEFDYLDGVTSAIQTQLNNKQPLAPNDIVETTFNAANNVSSFTSVTGLAFPDITVGSFSSLVQVALDATAPKYESFVLRGTQKNGAWVMNYTSVGDDSGVIFNIINSGQIEYKSTNATGFVSLTMRFRAESLSV